MSDGRYINKITRKAIQDCRKAIDEAAAQLIAKDECNRHFVEQIVLTRLVAEWIAKDKPLRVTDRGMVGFISYAAVEAYIHWGEMAKEPIVMHALNVLYLLDEEEKCKAYRRLLRDMAKAFAGEIYEIETDTVH